MRLHLPYRTQLFAPSATTSSTWPDLESDRAIPGVNPARVAIVSSALGAGALALQAAAAGVSELAVFSGLSLAWGALATTGVMFPSLQVYGHVVCRGRSGKARVALTFDDGPHPVTTRLVLEALARTRHRATFFVLGDKVKRHPNVVREIHAAGHSIGLHGYHHDRCHSFRLTRSVYDGIMRAADAVDAAIGVRPCYFRPPLGHTSITTVRGARRAGVTLVAWSSRGFDGVRHRSPDAVITRVDRTLTDGAIVMLHDASEHDDFEPASVSALPRLLSRLDERRLVSVPLEVLLAG